MPAPVGGGDGEGTPVLPRAPRRGHKRCFLPRWLPRPLRRQRGRDRAALGRVERQGIELSRVAREYRPGSRLLPRWAARARRGRERVHVVIAPAGGEGWAAEGEVNGTPGGHAAGAADPTGRIPRVIKKRPVRF